MAALFPWSWAAAWLRTMTALNDTPIGVDWRQMRRAAGEQAGLWTGQGWRLLLLFGFAWVVLFVNIILALALLPMLLKSLTGQESWMSRLGGNLVGSMPFLWISIGLTWLVLDPLIQAAYVVRSFHGESLVTGEDLLARLRRLKQPLAAVILACCLAAAATPALADAVTGAELNQAIRKTLHTSEFEWMTRPAPPPTAETALERLARRVFEPFERAMDWAGGRIQEIFEWLREMLQTRSDIEKQPKVQAPGGLTLLLAAGGFVLLLAGAYLVLRNRRLRKDTRRRVAAPVTAVDLSDEDLDASRLPEQEWLVLASNLEAEGDLRAALRALYLSNLAWLSTAGLVVIHRAVTNGEYRREVARKARATPALVQAFGDNVRQFEAAWYGWHAVTGEDYAAFRDRTGQMKLAEVKR